MLGLSTATSAHEKLECALCPVMYMMNLDDRYMTHNSCLALFDVLGTDDKRVLAFPEFHGQNLDQALPELGKVLRRLG